MRYHIAEAIRINGLPAEHRRTAIQQLPLGIRTVVASLAKHLQGRTMKQLSTCAPRSVRDE